MKRWIISLVFFLTLVISSPSQVAGSITLAWDKSPDLTVVGYTLYYGFIGGNTTNSTSVGNVDIVTLNNLISGSTYFFFVTAYNSQLIESDPSNVITDTIYPANGPPTLLSVPSSILINPNESFSFKISAADPNPEQTLAFSLAIGAPNGCTINPVTGMLSWTPTINQGGTTYTITVRITDNGTPALSDAKTFVIMVPAIVSRLPAPTHIQVKLM